MPEEIDYLNDKANAMRLVTGIYEWWAKKGVHPTVWIEEYSSPVKAGPLRVQYFIRSNIDPWTGKLRAKS